MFTETDPKSASESSQSEEEIDDAFLGQFTSNYEFLCCTHQISRVNEGNAQMKSISYQRNAIYSDLVDELCEKTP
jgi:hypothetical protein